MKNNYGFSSKSTFSLAGWLFADLFLVLFVIFFAGSIKHRSAENHPEESTIIYPTYTPCPASIPYLTTTPYPTYTPYPTHMQVVKKQSGVGVAVDPVVRFIVVNNGETLRSVIRREFDAYKNEKAGFVIVLGHHVSSAEGNRIANDAKRVLLGLSSYYPDMPIFDNSAIKTYWYTPNENSPSGSVTIEAYFLIDLNGN